MHLKHETFLYSGIANRKLIVAIGIASLAKSDLASYGVPLGWGEICPIDVRSWKPVCHWGWCEIYSLMWESARARILWQRGSITIEHDAYCLPEKLHMNDHRPLIQPFCWCSSDSLMSCFPAGILQMLMGWPSTNASVKFVHLPARPRWEHFGHYKITCRLEVGTNLASFAAAIWMVWGETCIETIEHVYLCVLKGCKNTDYMLRSFMYVHMLWSSWALCNWPHEAA